MSRVVGIIPARWSSTRFPGKAIRELAGKPLVQHVWHRCCEAGIFDQIIVATDDTRIAETVFGFGGEVSLTSSEHLSGTDRIAEVARKLKKAAIVFNIQGDEPLVEPALLRRLTKRILLDKTIKIITAAKLISPEAAKREHVVKVVFNQAQDALYFSRSEIPFSRTGLDRPLYQHLGIYGYRRSALLKFVRLRPGPLEQAEHLEQLRALENGMKIRVIVSESRAIGVDTPEDLYEAEKLLLQQDQAFSKR
jgi:3-deoxy-manno-octulosonate cytidylyltransferase (CMP-KDO synthetase)